MRFAELLRDDDVPERETIADEDTLPVGLDPDLVDRERPLVGLALEADAAAGARLGQIDDEGRAARHARDAYARPGLDGRDDHPRVRRIEEGRVELEGRPLG